MIMTGKQITHVDHLMFGNSVDEKNVVAGLDKFPDHEQRQQKPKRSSGVELR